jgi:hypothetical protein
MFPLFCGKQAATTPKRMRNPADAHLTINEYLATFLYVFAPKNATRQKKADNATPTRSKTKLFQFPKWVVQSDHQNGPVAPPVDIVGSKFALTNIKI